MSQRVPSFLIDQDVIRNGLVTSQRVATQQMSREERKIGWGTVVSDKIFTLVPIPKSFRDDEVRRKENRAYLAGLAVAAHKKEVKLYTSVELLNEQRRQKIGRQLVDVNIFDVVEFEMAKCPATRNYTENWEPWSVKSVSERLKAEQQNFFEKIAEPRYVKLKKHLGKHFSDVFHYWTAEVNKLDGFITLDEKFQNAFTMQSKLFDPISRVMSPKEACEYHDISPIDVDKNVLEKLSGLNSFKYSWPLAFVALGIE